MTEEGLMEILRDIVAAGQNQAGGYEWGTGASKPELQARDLRVQVIDAFAELRVERDLATEQALRLREAVEAVEWVYSPSDFDTVRKQYGSWTCPWCLEDKEDGHSPDCLRQRALGITKGA